MNFPYPRSIGVMIVVFSKEYLNLFSLLKERRHCHNKNSYSKIDNYLRTLFSKTHANKTSLQFKKSLFKMSIYEKCVSYKHMSDYLWEFLSKSVSSFGMQKCQTPMIQTIRNIDKHTNKHQIQFDNTIFIKRIFIKQIIIISLTIISSTKYNKSNKIKSKSFAKVKNEQPLRVLV